MTSHIKPFTVRALEIPGDGMLTEVARCDTLVEAREFAERYSHRRDLTSQDVKIERYTGRGWAHVQYAGPCR